MTVGAGDPGLEHRARVIAEIGPLPLPDALARIAYFNKRECRGNSEPIDPLTIGLPFDRQAIAAAWWKVAHLYNDAMLVADADLSGAPGRERRAAELRAKHPDFSEKSYGLAMTDGYIAMR